VPTSAQSAGASNAAVNLRLDSSEFGSSGAARNGRSPEFIGASVTNVAYSFTPGPIAGTIALSTCAQSGTPTVYTCTIGLPANTYNLSVTLEHNTTAVGTGTASGIAVAPNVSTPISLTISPINAGPTLAVSGATTQFYVDGHAQTISTTLNELDPAGNIITTFYGPVTNYPTLTVTDGGGTTGASIGTPSYSVVPATQAGSTDSIGYNGTGVNATSLTLSVSDGTNTSNTVTIPYVSATTSAPSVQFATTGAGGAQTVTFAEAASSGGSASFDTSVTSGTTCSPSDVTFSPTVTGGTNALTAGALTYTLTASDVTFTQCAFTLTSVKDPNLTVTVAVKPSGGAGVIISSTTRETR
jgi:hypothetical protein